MNLPTGGRGWLSPFIHLSNNWISLLGVVLVTTTTILWLFLLPVTMKGETENPYIGMLAFLTIPGPFFGGLILIPLGMWLKRRREGRAAIYPPEFPASPGTITSCASWSTSSASPPSSNIVIASQLGLQRRQLHGLGELLRQDLPHRDAAGIHRLPEFAALPRGVREVPHRPGRRLVCEEQDLRHGAADGGHLQHVPAAHPDSRPQSASGARDLRGCHWPQKYGEDRDRVINKFADDETNRLTKTVLLMKIGGGNHGVGIHGTHLGPGSPDPLRATDEQRQNIPWVEYDGPGRKTV